MDMAGCGTGQGHGHPVPPAQNNGFPPWGSQPPTSAQYPASQHINNPNDYSYGGAPNAVLCQTSDGVTGFMIWHGDPNAFPAVAQIQYSNGPVYPASCPPQSTDWGSMLPPTPDSALISTQGFVPRHDPSLPVAQYQPKPGARDGIPPVPTWDVPRVMPMPSAGEIDLLNLGQWQGQAVPGPGPLPVPGLGLGNTAVELRERQMIEPRSVVESTVHTMDLLTQPMTSHEPSYILTGNGQKRNIWEGSIEEITIDDDEVGSPDIFDEISKDQSKSPNIPENDGGSSTSKEATTSLEPSPLILSSSIGSPARRRKNVAKPSTPVKRFLATSNNVQPRKKRPAMDGAVRFPTSSYVPGAVRLPVISETIIDLEDYAAGTVVELPQGSTMPEGDTEDVDYSRFLSLSPKWEAEMDCVFDFDGASLGWKNDPFWENEDPAQTGEQSCPRHPMMVFRGTEKAPFNLDAWVDDELEMSLWTL